MNNKKQSDSELLANVRDKLIEEYHGLEMKGLPWMKELGFSLEEYYVDLILAKMDKRGIEVSSEPIKVEDVLTPVNKRKKLSRILIEGGPGMGKSTLAAKLAYDWAKEKDYIRHFDLVVLIPLRHFTGELKDLFCCAIPCKEQDYMSMLRILQDKSKDILFIMDGYDEISPETEAVVLPLIKREAYSHTTVIVVSRPGRFPNKEEGHKATIQIHTDFSPSFSSFIQKRVMVNGFTEKHQKEFVKTHIVVKAIGER